MIGAIKKKKKKNIRKASVTMNELMTFKGKYHYTKGPEKRLEFSM